MPVTLTDRQSVKVAAALRRGAVDSFRIADAIDPGGQIHFLIEVSDMGQFAKDWDGLKTMIRQKDDAIDRQAAQIAALQQQLASHQAFDADDQKAIAELRQTMADNTPTPKAVSTPHVSQPAVTTFTK